jgi:hypothetical protein
MSELTDSIVKRYLDQTPERGDAFRDSPMFHAQVTWTRDVLDLMERAMGREGVPPGARLRILNAVVFGDPEGSEEEEADG